MSHEGALTTRISDTYARVGRVGAEQGVMVIIIMMAGRKKKPVNRM